MPRRNLLASDHASFGNTTAGVLETIIEGMASGEYAPGDRVNAAQLAKALGLSKAPVREALHVLAGEGIIDMPKNRGAFIRKLSDADLLRLWDVFALNFGRELRVAARAVARAGPDRPLIEAMARIAAAGQRRGALAFLQALHGFHYEVARLAGDDFAMPSQIRRLAEFWIPTIARRVPLERYLGPYVGNYQRICDALVAGDGRSAESAFHYHARWSQAILRGDPVPESGAWCDEP